MSARPDLARRRQERRSSPRLEARARREPARRFSGNDGFTLIEVLVAFTVMAVLLSVLFRGVVVMRAGANAFDDRTHVELVAHAVLDDALAQRAMREGTYSGTREGRPWTIVAKAVDLTAQLPAPPEDPAQRQPPGTPPERLKWTTQRLVVSVAAGARTIQVETIRLIKAEPRP